MRWYGDWPVDSTIHFYFDTYDSSGGNVTMTGLAATDIEIYKGSSTTQRSSDAGITLIDTDGIDVDGLTGFHGFSVDLSDNTDAGFYAAGSQYTVRVQTVTVDSQTVGFSYGFTIEVANGSIALLKDGTFGLSAIETLVDELESRLTAARAGYLDNLNGHTAQTGDSFARLGAPAGASVSADIATVDGNVDSILADTGTDGVVVATASKTGYALSSAGVDAILDEAITEPSGVFSWPGTLRNIVGFLGALARNKKTQTATTFTLRDDGDASNIATSTVSDDGTTATKGEMT